MYMNCAIKAGSTFNPDPKDPIMESIFQQYERVLVDSLVTSFGLDFLLDDRHGGDVDTVHNVRQIRNGSPMEYKNAKNAQDYDQRGEYKSEYYHKDKRYIEKNREISAQKKEGILADAYTGDRIAINGKSDLDHVISAKEIHEDRARVLAGLKGTDLANSNENLQATNSHTNRSKKADSMEVFLEKHSDEYTPEQQANMRRKDAIARKAYEEKIARTYYTSPKFATDLALAAGKVGLGMGVRQAAGFVFAEMWFAVKDEFQNVQDAAFDFANFLRALGKGIKRGFERAKKKYKEIFSKFLSGTCAGALSSLTTTLCNIFFTTSKNVVRIIRQSYVSLVEAGKVLFINPANYTFGERMRAVVKILATGASVVMGVIVSDAVGNTGIKAIPVLGDIVPSFCGAFVSGIMSCTLLYYLDRSELMNKLFRVLDCLPSVASDIAYYRQQAEYLEKYAAELESIDLLQFKKEIALYGQIGSDLEAAESEEEVNVVLRNAMKSANIPLPWKGYDSFDKFMGDKDSILVFG